MFTGNYFVSILWIREWGMGLSKAIISDRLSDNSALSILSPRFSVLSSSQKHLIGSVVLVHFTIHITDDSSCEDLRVYLSPISSEREAVS